jgi:hypothetical protein
MWSHLVDRIPDTGQPINGPVLMLCLFQGKQPVRYSSVPIVPKNCAGDKGAIQVGVDKFGYVFFTEAWDIRCMVDLLHLLKDEPITTSLFSHHNEGGPIVVIYTMAITRDERR